MPGGGPLRAWFPAPVVAICGALAPMRSRAAFTESMNATLSSSDSRCHSNGIFGDDVRDPSPFTQSMW